MKVKIAIEFEVNLDDVASDTDSMYIADDVDDVVWAIVDELKNLPGTEYCDYVYLAESDKGYDKGCFYED